MKQMNRWLAILLSVILAAGSIQLPANAADAKDDAFEEVNIGCTGNTEIAEEEEPQGSFAQEPSGATGAAEESATAEASAAAEESADDTNTENPPAASGTTVVNGIEYTIEDGAATVTGYKGSPKNVVSPENVNGCPVTMIGDSAFSSCTTLTQITLPEGIERLSYSCFEGCVSLKELNIPSTVKYIGQSALTFTGITELHLPSGLEFISSEMLMEKLVSVEVEEGNEIYRSQDGILYAYNKVDEERTWVVWIYPLARKDETYAVPDFVEIFDTRNMRGHYIFEDSGDIHYEFREYPHKVDIGRHRVSSVFCAEYELLASDDNPYYTVIDGCLYSKDGKSLRCVPATIEGDFTIPDGVTAVESDAFYHTRISSVKIPNSVAYFGDYVFAEAANLKEIRFPETVSEFGHSICSNAVSLRTVYLPKNLEVLPQWTFGYCQLDSLSVPKSLSVIEDECFYSADVVEIFYEGTKAQWEAIEIGNYNSRIESAQEWDAVYYKHYGGHSWETEYTVDQEPTYTEEGRKSFHCSVCDAINYDSVTPIPRKKNTLGKTTRGDMFNLANNVKVTWKAIPGAKYYKVYRTGLTAPGESRKDPVIVTTGLVGWDSQPGLTNGHAYSYKIVASTTGRGDSSGDSALSYSKVMYRLKTVVIRSAKNTAPGAVTVKYDKTASGDSYVLQYSEREDMAGAKTKVVLGASNTSYVIGGLKKGRTYYISIRVRKKVGGIDYYTTFGVPKKVRIER